MLACHHRTRARPWEAAHQGQAESHPRRSDKLEIYSEYETQPGPVPCDDWPVEVEEPLQLNQGGIRVAACPTGLLPPALSPAGLQAGLPPPGQVSPTGPATADPGGTHFAKIARTGVPRAIRITR